MAEPPDRLKAALADRYTIERELGQGGMATVYLARDLRHERPVALKVLRPELAASLGPDRFLREIKTTAQLAHPHILPLLDSGDAGGTLFYVMPFVEGESLRDRLTRERQLPLDEALRITREVADALGYAHSLGLVHRDIKPENILFEAGHAVVADFGIAKAIAAAGSARLTETGLAIGTPAYMSPEQAAGSQDLDGRSDLYSLGCVLYEMLSGETPYTGPSTQAILAKKLSEPLPRISVVREAVPAGIEAALSKSLARTPADRWVTAAQFAEALTHFEAMGAAVGAAPRSGWRRRALWLATAVAAVAALAAVLVVGRRLLSGQIGARHPRTAIAVLPLENLSAQGPFAYFAGGLHDELLTQLAKVASLTVIGRASVRAYEGTSKRLREIGDELAVGSIVEGSVQVVGKRLRVIVQLIDPVTETHLWAEHYDRTLNDAFTVESDIAQRIVAGVGATLSAAEAGAITAAPTRTPEAYRLYLQGLEYWHRPGYLGENLRIAQQFYERALALDPSFALAHAALSQVHWAMRWFAYDLRPARLQRQQAEADTALRLAPDLPAAHVAMAFAYKSSRGQRWALYEYSLALRGDPSDAELWHWIGDAHRELGNWDSMYAAFAKASQLDPRSADVVAEIAETDVAMRRYGDAVRAFERYQRLAPDDPSGAVWKGLIYAVWKGELDTLRRALEGLSPDADLGDEGTATVERAKLLFWARQPDSLLELLRGSRAVVFQAQRSVLPRSLYAAWAHLLRGEAMAAHTAFDSARTLLDSAVRAIPGDWRVHAARGQALAGLGRRQEALGEARWLEQSDVYRESHFESGFTAAEGRASILARVGETETALVEIERLLSSPSYFSTHTFRLDPRWDPIRADSRFQALLVKYAHTETR